MSLPGRQTALIVSIAGRAGRWACRSLNASGFRVIGTYTDRRTALTGGAPYSDEIVQLASPRDDPAAFAEELVGVVERERPDVVLSTENEAASEVLARVRERLQAAVVGPDERQYLAVCDKAVLDETAREAGLDSPRTVLVDRSGAGEELPPLPSIVKPAKAIRGAGWGEQQRSAAVAHTEQERDELVSELVDFAGAALVQEHVSGRAWRIHFVASQTSLAALPVITRLSYPRDAGMSTVQHVPVQAPLKIFDDTDKLIRQIGYVGPGSIQFLERDGRYFVHDVNLRMPSSVAISIRAGLDMPTLAARVALGDEDAVDRVELRRGVTYVWLGGEVRALRAAPSPRALARFARLVSTAGLGHRNVLDYFPVRARLRSYLQTRKG